MHPPASGPRADYPDPALPPECAAARASQQRRLDGETSGDDAAAHLTACPSCRVLEAAVRRLEEGLSRLPRPVVPTGFADRVLDTLATRPARRYRLTAVVAAGLALAASVLVAVVLIERPSGSDPRHVTVSARPLPKAEEPAKATETPPVALRDALHEMGDAVASLTWKTAEETLLRRMPQLTLPKVPDPMTGPLEPLEPAMTTIQQVQHGAVFSVAPITNSAKRAADMLWREIAPDPDMKPPIN
jgi:anti-sigma factor RsiW